MMSERSFHIGPNIGPRIGVDGDPSGGAAAQTTLGVAISDANDPVITAVNLNFSCVCANTGAADATNVTMTVTLDASLAFVSGSGTGWVVNAVGQVVTCTRASIAVADSKSVIVTVTTGGSALTASTTLDALADNAPAATQDTETTVVKLVDRDAGDGKRYPSTLTQWSDFNAYHVAIGTANFPSVTWSALYLCQEASGNLADSIGTFTLTATGTGQSYQQTIGSSTRKAVKTASGTTGLFANVDIGLPNLATTSMLTLAVANVTTTAARRDIIGTGLAATPNMLDTEATTGLVRAVCVGNVAPGAADAGGANRPIVTQVNRAGSVSLGATDVDKLLPALAGTVAGATLAIGNYKFGAATCLYSYIVVAFAAQAEITATQIKALLGAMGHTITWS